MGRKEPRNTAWAVAVSLALHAALLAYLGTRPPRAFENLERPIEVTLISVPPLPEEAPKPPEPPKEVAPEPEPPKPTPRKPVRAEPEPAPQPSPEPPAQPEAPPPVVDDIPRAAPELPSRPAMVGGLAPSATWALSLDAGVDWAERPRGVRAPEVPTDLAGDAVRKTLGRGRVDRGLVNSYYATLGKALIKSWDADRAVSQFGLKGYVEQMGENTQIWNNIWKDRASEFGKTGNPYGDDSPNSDIARRIDARLPGGFDQQSQRAANKKMGDAFRSTKRATIRVVQHTDGHLLKVELVEPSNDTRVDNEALADVRAAAEKLPAPTPDAIEGKDVLSSLWQFELIVSISPPIPTLTFEFDEALGFIDARLPLDRRIYKRVRLVSVE
jgi:TonB C terminal